jgi:ankyrin repeat protein
MSTQQPQPAPRPLPDLRHLKEQAKDLLDAGDAASLAEAQLQVARSYGFASWPKLNAYVESLQEVRQLKEAIDSNDLDCVKAMMTRNPALHRAPLGYGKNGPLTWVAECRVPREAPRPERLAMAAWMIDNGSDVHQGGDGPLMRAALADERVPMMELLVARGADVNAVWGGQYPIIFAPCEAVAPRALKWLLDHGANPNCPDAARRYSGTALDMLLETYGRSRRLGECIDILLAAGGATRHVNPVILDLLRGRLELLAAHLDADPALLHRRFPNLDIGQTGNRWLTLKGGTLLHVAAEYGDADAVRLLLDRGADVNAGAGVDAAGVGGQTPIFHAATQFSDWGLSVVELLLDRGADLSVRAKLPGHYDRPGETVDCTPLEYAERFPGGPSISQTVALLRERARPAGA